MLFRKYKKKSTVVPVTRLWRRCGVGIGALGFRTEDKTVVVQCLGGGGGGLPYKSDRYDRSKF